MRFHRSILILVLVSTAAIGPAAADLRYKTEIVGASGDLGDLIEEASQLKQLEERPPASEEALRRRADEDLDRLKDAAHSLGYWDAQISYAVETGADPAKVTVTVEPGPVYRVEAITVLGPDGQPLAIPPDPDAADAAINLPLKPGDPARTAPVIETEAALLGRLGHQGHPFAKSTDRKVVIDHDTRTMAVTWRLDPGPVMRFGPVAVSELERLDPRYVERRVEWQQGAIFDARKVEDTRRVLIESGLFSTVRVTPERDPADPGQVRMLIAATERPQRTVGAGLAYNTEQGPGARFFWEHRNLFGTAEKLRLSAEIGQQQSGFAADFRRPDMFGKDFDLLAHAGIANETPVAYRSRRAQLGTGVEWRPERKLTLGAALALEVANVTQSSTASAFSAAERTQRYALIGLPLSAKLDESDDIFNPTRGYRAQINVTPYKSVSGRDIAFTSNRIAGTMYHRIAGSENYVLAAAAALGTIDGAALRDLPADKRIYAGGGGSNRAYGYQKAGPLDFNKKPIGGKSSLELNLELRIKITDTIGVVPFVDGGGYYLSELPQLGRRFLYGGGLGLRYYTNFGPVRLDLATPFNRRKGDSPIQLYISLGQAF